MVGFEIDCIPNGGHFSLQVFKLKGADRKHKQDREKILKRPPSEQEKYQRSYDYTILGEISREHLFNAFTSQFSPEQ